ncbi:MAG: glutamyl-tRNA amidotransferase [Gammaproteobacteria bacterium]|nr:MAG: glutamyl-tRNA amidotransferase [Pseudomonadota bacterium]PIE37927.1 MAG: glutamyl-tRNA amidotransferase [Gammaproteobacteria bacterium]
MSATLKTQITEAMKAAMKAKEKERLATIRLILADFKRIEVDERIEIDDDRALAILDKMMKQRKDSLSQFEKAGRNDLADIERAEMKVIQEFLPAALSESEILAIIREAIEQTGASGMQGMGKVMGIIKPKLQGRADMSSVSKLVKDALA